MLLRGDVGDGDPDRRRWDVDDRVRVVAIVELRRLRRAHVRLVLVVRRKHLDRSAHRAGPILLLEVLDGHPDRLDAVLAADVGIHAGLVIDDREDHLAVRQPDRPLAGRRPQEPENDHDGTDQRSPPLHALTSR